MDYIIATVSTADLEKEWLDTHNVPIISYTFVLDGEVYIDDCTEEVKSMIYQKMREGKAPSTSQISEYAYEEFFRGLLDTGKDVIFVDMSRAISSSISNAEEAIIRVTKDYPDQKFHFIDSFNITGGLALFIRRLVAMKENGVSFDETVAWGEANKKNYIHRFFVDDLQWLRRGGRLSNASAIVGTLLSIKPLLYVRDDGSLVAFDKIRGRKKAMRALVESTKEDYDPAFSGEEVYVYHADCEKDAEDLAGILKETYPGINVSIHTEGPVIGSHVGPGFMAILYRGKDRVM